MLDTRKDVLLTGAAGFLGREVLRQLRLREDIRTITAIDSFDPLCGSSPDVEGVEVADVRFPLVFDQRPTHIIHLAAYARNLTCEKYPYHAFNVNVNGTFQILEYAREYDAEMLCCSSNIVLSEQDTVYRMTKRNAEELVRLYARHGTRAMILRPSNIAGPGQSRTEYQPCSFAAMDATFEEKGYIEITGDGSQRRDFIHVSDVARAFMLALDHNVPGATLDICRGSTISLLEVMRMLGVEYKLVDERPGDAKLLISDARPAANVLKFKAEIPLKQTIEDSFPSVLSAKALRVAKEQLLRGSIEPQDSSRFFETPHGPVSFGEGLGDLAKNETSHSC